MIEINGFEKEYVIDLNETMDDNYTVSVLSLNDEGSSLPWGIEMMSCDFLEAKPEGSKLNINVDSESMNHECYIMLKNYAKERIKVIVKPNLWVMTPKVYKFKITKKEVIDNKVRIKILSKVNDKDIGWKCTYAGQPVGYSISPMKGSKGEYIDITLKDDVYTDVESLLEFTQDKSENVIQVRLRHTKDSTEIIKAG